MSPNRIRSNTFESGKIHFKRLSPNNPTSEKLIHEVLKELKPGENQVLYDLGSGDGRVLRIAASEFGLITKGFELDEKRIKESQKSFKSLPMNKRKKIELNKQDLFTIDLRETDIVFLYVLPYTFPHLVQSILTCRPGVTIIFVLYVPDGDTKSKMGIKILSKIEAEGTAWYAYIAEKL